MKSLDQKRLNEDRQETWASGDLPKMRVEPAIAGELLATRSRFMQAIASSTSPRRPVTLLYPRPGGVRE